MKKVVMIVPQRDFRDEELFVPKAAFEKKGIEVKLASSSLNTASGRLGGNAQPDMLVSDVRAEDFAAIIFVGGNGAEEYFADPAAHKLAQEAVKENRIVAAICIAPVTLARCGVLKGKRATVWLSEGKEIEKYGAIFTAKPVEKDGNIITATGPEAVEEFTGTLLEALNN